MEHKRTIRSTCRECPGPPINQPGTASTRRRYSVAWVSNALTETYVTQERLQSGTWYSWRCSR
jgi:hypothetical protein